MNEIESLRSELINQSAILESELNQVAANLDAINVECGTCLQESDIDQLVVSVNYTKVSELYQSIVLCLRREN